MNNQLNTDEQSQTLNHKLLLEFFEPLRNTRTTILGIGNVLKGDDALGPTVCEELKAKNISAEVIDAATVPENYIQYLIIKAPENLVVIDAIDFAAKPGEIQIFQTEQLNSIVVSTHTLSPRIFVDMIQRSINLNVYFIGVQPAQTQFGSDLSPEVKKSIEILTRIFIHIFTI